MKKPLTINEAAAMGGRVMNAKYPPEVRRKWQSKAGIASGKARRRKKRERAEALKIKAKERTG